MNKMDAGNLSSKGEITKAKSLTPAVLGVPKSHGVKLSLMTSEDKKEFMEKLEEWRKERREKLAAKILAKQKMVEKPKPQINSALLKTKSLIPSLRGIPKSQDRESVFERLYKGNGKFKKPEANDISNKITEAKNFKKSLAAVNRPLKVLEVDTVPGEISQSSVCELVPGENLNGLINVSSGSEISTESRTQITLQEPSEATDSTFDNISQFTEPKFPEPKPIRSKNKMTEKPEINKSSRLTETACKKLPPKIPLRRSISMVFRQKSKTKNVITKSLSVKNIHEFQDMRESIYDNELKPKTEAVEKSVSFVTPKTKQFSSAHLRSKLEDWLKMNGHSLEGYRHLRCFEIDNTTLPRPLPSAHSDNLESSQYSMAPNTPLDDSNKENITPPTVIHQVDVTEVENWLKELLVLISKMKYPSDRCEEWLAAIRKKYPKCSQLPTYWECLAALNESKGDVKSAIEDYERAIIKGGEVESVGNSLAQLFDKMVLEQKKPTKSKIERGIDPKNIFKSTIIKFALQQKTLRKLGPQMTQNVREQLYVATPVRRSSRNQTPLKSEEVVSLETLTPDVKRNLTFKPNESLLEAD